MVGFDFDISTLEFNQIICKQNPESRSVPTHLTITLHEIHQQLESSLPGRSGETRRAAVESGEPLLQLYEEEVAGVEPVRQEVEGLLALLHTTVGPLSLGEAGRGCCQPGLDSGGRVESRAGRALVGGGGERGWTASTGPRHFTTLTQANTEARVGTPPCTGCPLKEGSCFEGHIRG